MNIKAFFILLIVAVTFSAAFANTNKAMKEAQQQKVGIAYNCFKQSLIKIENATNELK